MYRSNEGLTIIEILAVLAILTVIFTIAVPKITTTVSNAKELTLLRDMERILQALQRYCTEQEILSSAKDCQLNDLIVSGETWHGADESNQSPVVQSALDRYVQDTVPSYFSITITVDSDNWLTPDNYGCVSIRYPSVKADGSRQYSGGLRPTDFAEQIFTEAGWADYINQHQAEPVKFILDVDGDGADGHQDFLVGNIYFELNPTHSHQADSTELIEGTDGDDILHGTPDADKIYGYAGNDMIYGYAEDDIIDGGSGIDTAVFSSYWVYYSITGEEPYIITGPEGTDALISIEHLKFLDRTFTTEDFEDEIEELFVYGTDGDDYLSGRWCEEDIFIASAGIDVAETDLIGFDTIVFDGPRADYTINEGLWLSESSVSDGHGNITKFVALYGIKLQFTDQVYYAR